MNSQIGTESLVGGQKKLLCVQGQQDERLTDLARTVKSVDLRLAKLTYEWQQRQALQTRFQEEHMKLLQTIITYLQSVTNVPSASSGSGNPVCVVEQTAHTLSRLMTSFINMSHRTELVRVTQRVDILSRNQCPVTTGFKTEPYSLFGRGEGPQDNPGW